MGEVWRARDTRLNREVAIKVLPEKVARDPEALARFEREAKAVAALSHPNVLGLFDLGRDGETVYAVTELLVGETLRERLQEGPLPQRKALEYALQVAQGLAAAHEKGVVHRDLKPENLFLTSDGRVKILDFGLAKMPEPAAENTRSPTAVAVTEPGAVMGTVGYMSPEQVRGKPLDKRSDIFSLGTILYEMLTGQKAFRGYIRRRDDGGDCAEGSAGARRGRTLPGGRRANPAALSRKAPRGPLRHGTRSHLRD